MDEVVIPEEITRSIVDHEGDYCKRVRHCLPSEILPTLSSSYQWQIGWMQSYAGEGYVRKAKILEIGSGNGFFLCYALKNGFDVTGVEPGNTDGFEERNVRAEALLKANGIEDPHVHLRTAAGEQLPFEDDTFDIVFNVSVLEHVNDIDKTLHEIMRVLKPGGIFMANIPTYASFYEGHYDILWIPYMPKKIARWYVRLLFRRDPSYINELIFTYPARFSKYMKRKGIDHFLFYHARRPGFMGRFFSSYSMAKKERYRPSFARFISPQSLSDAAVPATGTIQRLKRSLLDAATILLVSLGFAASFDLVCIKNDRRPRT